ncbi:hypothetical protein EV360DRAFT_73611 [Lentinula raphanica]|nr:hypothetical protein EV360DRAFT_73611 [Lentinula raphanica]
MTIDILDRTYTSDRRQLEIFLTSSFPFEPCYDIYLGLLEDREAPLFSTAIEILTEAVSCFASNKGIDNSINVSLDAMPSYAAFRYRLSIRIRTPISSRGLKAHSFNSHWKQIFIVLSDWINQDQPDEPSLMFPRVKWMAMQNSSKLKIPCGMNTAARLSDTISDTVQQSATLSHCSSLKVMQKYPWSIFLSWSIRAYRGISLSPSQRNEAMWDDLVVFGYKPQSVTAVHPSQSDPRTWTSSRSNLLKPTSFAHQQLSFSELLLPNTYRLLNLLNLNCPGFGETLPNLLNTLIQINMLTRKYRRLLGNGKVTLLDLLTPFIQINMLTIGNWETLLILLNRLIHNMLTVGNGKTPLTILNRLTHNMFLVGNGEMPTLFTLLNRLIRILLTRFRKYHLLIGNLGARETCLLILLSRIVHNLLTWEHCLIGNIGETRLLILLKRLIHNLLTQEYRLLNLKCCLRTRECCQPSCHCLLNQSNMLIREYSLLTWDHSLVMQFIKVVSNNYPLATSLLNQNPHSLHLLLPPTDPAKANHPPVSQSGHWLMVAPFVDLLQVQVGAPAPANQAESGPSATVEAEFRVIRQSSNNYNRREGMSLLPWERWQGKVGNHLIYKQGKSAKGVTIATKHLAKGGELMGTITFHSLQSMEQSIKQFINKLKSLEVEPANNVFLVAFGVSFLRQDPGVLKMNGSGAGRVLSEHDTVMWGCYAKMAWQLTEVLNDPNGSLQDLDKIQLFDIGPEDVKAAYNAEWMYLVSSAGARLKKKRDNASVSNEKYSPGGFGSKWTKYHDTIESNFAKFSTCEASRNRSRFCATSQLNFSLILVIGRGKNMGGRKVVVRKRPFQELKMRFHVALSISPFPDSDSDSNSDSNLDLYLYLCPRLQSYPPTYPITITPAGHGALMWRHVKHSKTHEARILIRTLEEEEKEEKEARGQGEGDIDDEEDFNREGSSSSMQFARKVWSSGESRDWGWGGDEMGKTLLGGWHIRGRNGEEDGKVDG